MQLRTMIGVFTVLIVAMGVFFIFRPSHQENPQEVPKEQKTLEERDRFVEIRQSNITAEEHEKIYAERLEIWEPWFQAAEKIAEISEDPLAREVVEYMINHGVLCAPDTLGPLTLEEVKEEPFFLILPMKKGDERIADPWEDILRVNAAARFMPGMRSMIIPQYEMTSPWKGIIMMHEGLHAYRYINEAYDWEDHQTFCQKEVEAHDFQNRLISKVVGKEYDDFIAEEVIKMKKVIKQEGMELGKTFPSRPEKYFLLDRIFDPSLSQMEDDIRVTHTWMHICFSIMEEVHKESAQERKALFLYTLYLESGLLVRE